MNVFLLDEDPVLAAQMLCNKHVIKMPSESANMLLLAIREQFDIPLPFSKNGKHIKLTHKNHPASIWLRESLENYRWGLANFIAMCDEYRNRYKRDHFSSNYINFIENAALKLEFARTEHTRFKGCFGDFNQMLCDVKDPIDAYRRYYCLDKWQFAFWPSKDKVPAWYFPEVNRAKLVDSSFKDGIYIKRR